jgi:peptidoglycan-N-acetylglucosamine deacetylase
MPLWHPFLTGRLARWRQVERWLEGVLARGNVWFAPLEAIAHHVLDHEAARHPVRVRRFPNYLDPVHLER